VFQLLERLARWKKKNCFKQEVYRQNLFFAPSGKLVDGIFLYTLQGGMEMHKKNMKLINRGGFA